MVSSGPLVVLSVGSPGQPVIVVPLGGNTKARVVNLQAEGGGLYKNQRGEGGAVTTMTSMTGCPGEPPERTTKGPDDNKGWWLAVSWPGGRGGEGQPSAKRLSAPPSGLKLDCHWNPKGAF